MANTNKQLLNAIAQAIYDKKGFNILGLDIQQRSLSADGSMADYMIIAEGNIDRHVKSLAQAVKEKLDELGEPLLYIDGKSSGDWVVMDYGQIIIHLLTPEFREKYELEKLWKQASIIDLEIDTSKS